MSYATSPIPSASTVRSRACRNEGTLRSVTWRARPFSTATRASTSPAGTSSRTTVSGSVTATIPVSTSTVATPIVPCPHIGRQPETSMKRTPQSASLARRRLEDRAGHRAVAARLAHEQQAEVVHLGRKCARRSSIVAPGHRPDAARDHARRHPLRVGVDGGEVARRPHAPTRACSARSAAARSSRSAARELRAAAGAPRRRRGRPRPSPPLKYCTSFGVMSKRASGSIRW